MATPRKTRIAYVMTHYPYPSQTFLMEEILGVSGELFDIVPIAINPVAAEDLLTDQHRSEHQRTTYIKAISKGRIAVTVAKLLMRHPVKMSRLMLNVAASAGTDLKLMIWRVMHLIEGVLVWDHCARNDVDHLHAQFGGLPAAVAMYAARVGREVVGRSNVSWSYTVHGFHDFVNENEIRLDVKTHSATFVVGISDFTASQLMRIADPNDWQKISVVRCGIALDRFPRRAVPAPRDVPVVVTVGRLSAEKGHIVLLNALRLLANEGVMLRLRLVGSGPYQDEIDREIARLGLTDQVELLGMLASHQVAEELLNADVFCLPSFAEGVPISIMEAMAIGVPVVSTAVGGIPELLTDGVTGWSTAPGRADQLAEALREATTRGANLDAVLAAARLRIETLHDAQQAAKQMQALFERYTRVPSR
jgi:colanic acid/amylovoran biosynthesis glycosyltransferase